MSHKGVRHWMHRMLEDDELFESSFVRFCSKITRDEFTGCWEWAGPPNKKGYVSFSVRLSARNWSHTTAHSAAYVFMVGPLPDGLQVDHRCENTGCVNPEHLALLTNRENTMKSRGPEKAGQHNKVKTHCLRGHEYTPENTYVSPSRGTRSCVTCNDAKWRRTYERKKAKALAAKRGE